ncbi:MAG TPA: type VI secretion system-associated protein TagO [Ensifer sp.]|jgi:type VI secretion system VasI family protein|uniref:type VI secretion system-associated protein TagO n=1 Tax=Ensifer sp. TaxID=1872086 RepID=UPI002E13935B|nr:type VI secretion system-associated protein TagO [Ensifer sp.]
MRAAALLVSAILLSAGSAMARDPQECARLEDSLQRLTCFDKMFPKAGAGEPANATAPASLSSAASLWEVQEEVSPVDDSKVVTAALMPAKSTSTGFDNASAYLLMSCREQTTSFIISTEMFMSGEEPTVTTRIGGAPAVTGKWSRSTNYKAVGLWSGKEAIPFIKSLKDNERLFIRLQDKDRVDAEFDLANVSEVVEKIKAACKW